MSLPGSTRNRAGALVACIAAVAAVPVLAQSAAGDPGGDAGIKDRVVKALNADTGLYAKHINVSVKQGVVRLGGFVGQPNDVERAKKDVEGIAGVKTVKNEVKVEPGESESSTSH
jgi:hyperosmotically inducible periplasmic protein